MISITYSTRVFPQKYGAVAIRVRWNHKKNEVEFTTGDWVEPEKWDSTAQRAVANTKHIVKTHANTASAINRRIGVVLGYIEQAFADFAHADEVPDSGAFRAAMAVFFEKENEEVVVKKKSMTLESMSSILAKFITERSLENSWKRHSKYKYTQIVDHLLTVKPGIRIDQIDKATLLALRTWLFKQKRHNASVARWFGALKAILRWAREHGYEVKNEALSFNPHVIVPQKQIIYLEFDELLAFHRFEFPKETPLSYVQARDMFCFMAFTSLRYSDMSNLKKADISRDYLQIYTVKTHDKLNIPLLSYAKEILERHKDTPGSKVFPAPLDQVLNKQIRAAARIAGLNRNVVETFFIDKGHYEVATPLWKTLSCHDARRTFVCCSLRLGIPPTIVMKCTGHSNYENMKPYIDVADEVVAKSMGLWETMETKQRIIKLLDTAGEDVLRKVLHILKK